MKALDKDAGFKQRARAFVLVRFDTRNGSAKGTKDLLVTRNNAYVLAIDAKGGEVRRLLDKNGEGSWSRVNDITVGREPMKRVDVLSAMDDVTQKRRAGIRGVELLLRMLRDKRPEIRDDGLWHLRARGRKAAAAVPSLIEFLIGPKDTRRRMQSDAAARALGDIGPAARDALPYLKKAALAGETPAARVLSMIDRDGKDVLATLIKILETPSISSLGAAYSIQRLGSKAAAAVPALISATRATKSRVQLHQGIEALGAIGPKARAAIPLLEKLAAGKRPSAKRVYWEVESAALTALERIRAPAK